MILLRLVSFEDHSHNTRTQHIYVIIPLANHMTLKRYKNNITYVTLPVSVVCTCFWKSGYLEAR